MIKRTILSVTFAGLSATALSAQEAENPVAETAQQPQAEAAATDASGPASDEIVKFGPWDILCEEGGGCFGRQVIDGGEDEESGEAGPDINVLLIPIAETEDGQATGPDGVLTAFIPLGINVSEPAAIVPADRPMTIPAWRGQFVECYPGNCAATGPVDFGLLSGGGEWIVRVLTADSGYVGFPIDLSQMGEAIEAAKSATEQVVSESSAPEEAQEPATAEPAQTDDGEDAPPAE